ncbi:MAG: glycosyltransferase family 2 protein [Zetaproteobacteria bacterium]|nr:MAG: glycosyltransferase family 2 protein [Zetaproteobacteria bacterium]
MNEASISAIVVTYRSRSHIDRCLKSLVDNHVREIWVVDNASDDGTAAYVAGHYPEIHLIRNEWNVGFAAANNQALVQISTPLVLLLNPDAWLEKGAALAMCAAMDACPDVGVVAPRIIRNNTIEPSLLRAPTVSGSLVFILAGMRIYGTGGFSGRAAAGYPWHKGGEGDHVRGACMLVRMCAVEQAGKLDERFFLYFEETEWCLRLRRYDWRVLLSPEAVAHHIGKASVRTHDRLPSMEYMRGAIFLWHTYFSTSNVWLLRFALFLMAFSKRLILVLLRRRPEQRDWLGQVIRLTRNPYSVPIGYPRARRPSCWPEKENNEA